MTCECEKLANQLKQKNVLISLLVINAVMFFVELFFGLLSESTALIADSLDMLADAAVYGVGLYAVGRPALVRIRSAQFSGVLETLLGIGVLLDVGRRFIWGSEPESLLMIIIGLLALAANIACLMLITKHKDDGIHMRASWIFSKNDVIANLGIIAGGILVAVSGSRYPDLIIGVIISAVVVRGGVQIWRESATELKTLSRPSLELS